MNVLAIEKEEIPQKEDLVYMLEHVIEEKGTEL